METIYLSLRAQVAVGTFFMKSPVYVYEEIISSIYQIFPASLFAAFSENNSVIITRRDILALQCLQPDLTLDVHPCTLQFRLPLLIHILAVDKLFATLKAKFIEYLV